MGFVQWIKRAVSTSDDCYIELYNLLLRCYVAADVDMDGKVDGGEFSGMIEALYFLHWKAFQAADADRDGKVDQGEFVTLINVLTETPKKLGLSLPALGEEDRKNMFAAMDENGDGAISFNEWLDFSMKTIIAQIQ